MFMFTFSHHSFHIKTHINLARYFFTIHTDTRWGVGFSVVC